MRREICSNIKLHAITGCDTTSYFYRVGKISPLKKVIKESELLNLISALGETMLLGEADVEDYMKFIQTTLYTGCEEATYVETRIRLYKEQKQKMNLPPDPDSCPSNSPLSSVLLDTLSAIK